jgi:hypothetical protein
MVPGGRAALAHGCTCSTLTNAAYRAGAPDETPFVDHRCPLHGSTFHDRVRPGRSSGPRCRCCSLPSTGRSTAPIRVRQTACSARLPHSAALPTSDRVRCVGGR